MITNYMVTTFNTSIHSMFLFVCLKMFSLKLYT